MHQRYNDGIVMENNISSEEVRDGAAETSVPRRASLLVKFVISIIAIMGIAWFVSALREKKAPEVVNADNLAVPTYPKFETVFEGGKEYVLGGVNFVFEPEQPDENNVPITKARLALTGLTRSGVPIEVATYRLGTYRGECEQFDGATYMIMSSVDPGALAFAQCVYDGLVRRLAVFQEGSTLVVKTRSLVEDREVAGLMPILTIDVTKIAQ